MMRLIPLIFANLHRHRLRTLFTVFSIAVAFLLYGLLAAVKNGFEANVQLVGADRLITMAKVSIVQPLPISYEQQIAAVPGVTGVTHSTWFGGTYQDVRNVITIFPVPPESYLAIYPEYVLPADQKQRWLRDRGGAIVGRSLAKRYGWKIGDRIPIRTSIYRRKDGSDEWDFLIDGIYDNRDPSGEAGDIYFHYDYFDEARDVGKGTIGWYIVRIADPKRAAQVASAIDARFTNSSAETKTGTEKAFVQGFANQVGDIGTIVTSIGVAVFFTMLLVSANTMAQSVRERTAELAVLKTLGFTDSAVLSMVLGESILLTLIGGALGTGLALLVVGRVGSTLRQYVSAFVFTPRALLGALILMIALGLIAGALPGTRALRLRVADALARR